MVRGCSRGEAEGEGKTCEAGGRYEQNYMESMRGDASAAAKLRQNGALRRTHAEIMSSTG